MSTNRISGIDRQDGINVLALIKKGENYVFLFTDEKRADVLRTLGRFANDKELDFNWYDAAMLSQKVRSDIKGDIK